MRQVLFFSILVCLIITNNYNAYSQSRWQGNVSLGGSFYKGNVNKRDYNFNSDIIHKDSLFEYSTKIAILYSFADTMLNNKDLAFSQSFDWKPNFRFSPFFVLTAYSNNFKGFKLKTGGFAGLKYTFIDSKKGKYSISTALQFEHEIYSPDIDGFIRPEKNLLRFSFRLKIKQKIGSQLTIENTTFYKPLIANFEDFLVDSQTKLNIKISENFIFSIVHQYQFNSRPPYEKIIKNDQIILFTLGFKFGKT